MPKSKIFRFEFFWLDFKKVFKDIWDQPIQEEDSAKIITAKFKRLRKGLKIWSKNTSNLASTIKASNEVIHMWDFFEEYRPLTDIEHNGRQILKEHLAKTLEYQRIYWKQRAIIRWVKFENEISHFFKTKATIKFWNNFIINLTDDNGNIFTDSKTKPMFCVRILNLGLVPLYQPLKNWNLPP